MLLKTTKQERRVICIIAALILLGIAGTILL